MAQSELERTFITLWRQLSGPVLEMEYRFYPARRWRFDFAHPETRIAIECDGGTWNGGRHVRGEGYSKDCEKLNMAARLNWRVFRFTSDMLSDAPYEHLTPVICAIEDALNDVEDVDIIGLTT